MKLTTEEIQEGSKVITEFMGYKIKDRHGEYAVILNDPHTEYLRCWAKYDSSWEWTMPVVDKINAMGKAFSLAIFKNYISLTVEKSGNKFYKDFSFSHSEYITGEQTGKEAIFKLLVK